jgi:hypothetical protein
MIVFFCAVVRLPVFGIVPFATAALIAILALNIWVYVNSGPGPTALPAPWHETSVAQVD